MQTIQIRTHVGSEGILKLSVPMELRDVEVDVLLVVQPASSDGAAPADEWPEGFFERFAGVFSDDPLDRGPQGEPEVREALK